MAPIRLKFKFSADLVEWSGRRNFLFRGRQDIVNYWDSPTESFKKCHTRLFPKNVWKDQRENFPKMCPRDQLACWVEIPWKVPVCLIALLSYFLRVCLPTSFETVLKQFLPQTTPETFGRAKCKMSAPIRFAAGLQDLRKIGNIVLPIFCSNAPNSLPCCRTNPLKYGSFLHLKKKHFLASFSLEMNVRNFSNHQHKSSDLVRHRKYFTAGDSQVNMFTMKTIFGQQSELYVTKCLINHVLSSTYFVPNSLLWMKWKALQQEKFGCN